MHRLLIALIALLSAANACSGNGAPPSESELKGLVDQLVSPNKEPVEHLDHVIQGMVEDTQNQRL
jgi:hypothetical protein